MKIATIIYKKLSFTNGWHIDDDKYKKICQEIEDKITSKYDLYLKTPKLTKKKRSKN